MKYNQKRWLLVILLLVGITGTVGIVAGALYQVQCVEGEEGFAGFISGIDQYGKHYVVYEIVDDSPAEDAGFQAGDTIVKVNDISVNPDEFANMLHRAKMGDTIVITSQRGDETYTTSLTMVVYPIRYGFHAETVWPENTTEVRKRCVQRTIMTIIPAYYRYQLENTCWDDRATYKKVQEHLREDPDRLDWQFYREHPYDMACVWDKNTFNRAMTSDR